MADRDEEQFCGLPDSKYPYYFMPFRGNQIAVNEEHGCFIYIEECWRKCVPESNNVLVYDNKWYYRA